MIFSDDKTFESFDDKVTCDFQDKFKFIFTYVIPALIV